MSLAIVNFYAQFRGPKITMGSITKITRPWRVAFAFTTKRTVFQRSNGVGTGLKESLQFAGCKSPRIFEVTLGVPDRERVPLENSPETSHSPALTPPVQGSLNLNLNSFPFQCVRFRRYACRLKNQTLKRHSSWVRSSGASSGSALAIGHLANTKTYISTILYSYYKFRKF